MAFAMQSEKFMMFPFEGGWSFANAEHKKCRHGKNHDGGTKQGKEIRQCRNGADGNGSGGWKPEPQDSGNYQGSSYSVRQSGLLGFEP